MSNIITVTSIADSGQGSLREAIALAQAGDTIQFAPTLANQTITLTSSQLSVNKNLTIDGGTNSVTISGNNSHRVFDIQGLATNFTLRNLTVADGFTPEAGAGIRTGLQNILTVENSQFKNNRAGFGGAITSGNFSTTTITNSKFENNDGTLANSEQGGGAIAVLSLSSLTVRESEFTNNKGINGGAINNLLSQLTVENSVFLNNDSTPGGPGNRGYGGAIYTDGASDDKNPDAGTLLIRNSRFEGNRGAGQGGALFLFIYPPDEVIVENSTIINNQLIKNAAGDSLGAGIRHGNGKLTLRNSTIANNQALAQGGGLWVGENSPITITNTTFSGNRAADNQGNGLGGAMTFNNGANPTNIINTTVVNNFAGAFAGAIFSGDEQVITLTNTLVANNTAGNRFKINQQTNRQLIDGGNNLEFPAVQTTDPKDVKITANALIADPKLGPLEENGGILIHTLLEGSAAINAGNNSIAPSVDQRGLQRVGTADIGAFEFGATPPIDPPTNPPINPPINNPVPLSLTTTNNLFLIQGGSGQAQLSVTLTERQTSSINELGVFAVDDDQGSVNGIAPGQLGYLQAALTRAQVIFSALPDNVFPNLSSSRSLNAPGMRLAFYLVQNSTTETVLTDLSAGRTPANVFFATAEANPDSFNHLRVSELGNGTFSLAWEDGLGGGNQDFNDLALTIQLTNEPPPMGTGVQGERELIDLRNQPLNLLPAEIGVNRDAAYDNSYGFYAVDDLTGRIGNLSPSDPGYAQAAVSQRLDLSAGVPSGQLLAPFLIADGTPEEFLTENANNQLGSGALAYFAFLGANPDGVDHVRLLGNNTFAFEDLFGGGDFDYNDLVVQVRFI